MSMFRELDYSGDIRKYPVFNFQLCHLMKFVVDQ